MSSARSADTSFAMDTDAPRQQEQQRLQQQQQAVVEQSTSQSLRQPSFATPFGDGALQVRSVEVLSVDLPLMMKSTEADGLSNV